METGKVNEFVDFHVPLDTRQIITVMILSQQSLVPILTVNSKVKKYNCLPMFLRS